MAVNGMDFYNFALQCLSKNDEINLRNAVGRAYYGVYHDICSKLQNCPNPATHVGVRDYLKNDSWLKGNEPFDKFKLLRLAAFLNSLHSQRKWADYRLDDEYTKVDADSAMTMARDAIDTSKEMYEMVFPAPVISTTSESGSTA